MLQYITYFLSLLHMTIQTFHLILQKATKLNNLLCRTFEIRSILLEHYDNKRMATLNWLMIIKEKRSDNIRNTTEY